jgi:hypothetical protein
MNFLCVKMIYSTFLSNIYSILHLKDVYIYVFMTCFTPYSHCDTAMDPWTVFIYAYMIKYDCLRAGRSGDRMPVRAKFSAPVQTGPEAHTASCKLGNRSYPVVRCGRGVTLNPLAVLVPRSKIEYSYTSTLPKGLCGL